MLSLYQERKGTWVKGSPAGLPAQSQVPPQELGQGFLPSLGHTPSEKLFPLKNNAGTCPSAHSPGPFEGIEAPASKERSTPTMLAALPQPSLALCAKSNLSTGFLPLVRGHDQVGDDEEDVLSLRNQRGFKQPLPDLSGTLLPRAVWQGVESLHGC